MEKNKKKATQEVAQEENALTATVEQVVEQQEAEVAKVLNLLSPEQLHQMLEKQLTEIRRKKMLADNRARFLSKRASIETVLEEMRKADNKGEFEVKTAAITLSAGNEYRKEDILNISNTALIVRFIETLLLEIDLKVKEIEHELLAA